MTALVAASPVYAQGTVTNATVTDKYSTVIQSMPTVETRCEMVDVPVYGNVQQQGNAAEGALFGMIIGGLLGDAVGGKDGAAAGAVMGGLVGADKGAKPRIGQKIIGYEKQRKCSDVTTYKDNEKLIYEYSIIEFTYEGFVYSVTFTK